MRWRARLRRSMRRLPISWQKLRPLWEINWEDQRLSSKLFSGTGDGTWVGPAFIGLGRRRVWCRLRDDCATRHRCKAEVICHDSFESGQDIPQLAALCIVLRASSRLARL